MSTAVVTKPMKKQNQNQQRNEMLMNRSVRHKQISVDGLSIFYREAGNSADPKLLLLHGFPSSSHQYRNLIPALADRFHVVAPDYPGFGNSDMPDPDSFDYTFDKISEVIEAFLTGINFTRFGLYMQDYGGPVGFRIVSRHPEWLEWLIVQNANTYEIGFNRAWDEVRYRFWNNRTPETEAPLHTILQLETIKQLYLHGHNNPELISPDNWNVDFRFMERPNARRVQMDLFYDYRSNIFLYHQWQQFLSEEQPKTLVFWGQNDFFLTPEGGEAYLRDVPDAEIHRIDSGHFVVEDSLEYVASNVRRFYEEKVSGPNRRKSSLHKMETSLT